MVESECGAVALGQAYVFPPLSFGGALVVHHRSVSTSRSSNRTCGFPCIRLSDKTSRLRPRQVVSKPGQTHEPEGLVEVREWIPPQHKPAHASAAEEPMVRRLFAGGGSLLRTRLESGARKVRFLGFRRENGPFTQAIGLSTRLLLHLFFECRYCRGG